LGLSLGQAGHLYALLTLTVKIKECLSDQKSQKLLFMIESASIEIVMKIMNSSWQSGDEITVSQSV
jgi:hypothetical protein